jgi:predicted Abi (CAAX) family protease
MDRKGAGYPHEILIILVIFILFLTFYVRDSRVLMPPVFLLIGIVMLLGGTVIREPMLVVGGVGLIGIAVVYAETVPF